MTTNFSEDQVGERIEAMRRRPQRFRDERVTMAHGAGGKASRALVEGLVVPLLANPALEQLSDAGLLTVGGVRLALTTDAFVVRPIRFPGGSIGELAVNGTVNDLAVSGARPVAPLGCRSFSRKGSPRRTSRRRSPPWQLRHEQPTYPW